MAVVLTFAVTYIYIHYVKAGTSLFLFLLACINHNLFSSSHSPIHSKITDKKTFTSSKSGNMEIATGWKHKSVCDSIKRDSFEF